MQKVIKIEIECGERTCASEPGVWCKMIGTKIYGSRWVCTLFQDKDGRTFTELEDKDGWIQRCPACLEAAP